MRVCVLLLVGLLAGCPKSVRLGVADIPTDACPSVDELDDLGLEAVGAPYGEVLAASLTGLDQQARYRLLGQDVPLAVVQLEDAGVHASAKGWLLACSYSRFADLGAQMTVPSDATAFEKREWRRLEKQELHPKFRGMRDLAIRRVTEAMQSDPTAAWIPRAERLRTALIATFE